MSRVVLVLAHDGVAQPRVWERWESGGGVRLFVHCPPSAAGPLCANRLRIPYGRSRWGEASIVRETLRALKAVLAAEEGDFVLFLASGYCVPVAPTSAFRDSPHKTRFGGLCTYGRSSQVSQWGCFTREACERLVDHFERPGVFAAEATACARTGLCPDNVLFMNVLTDAPQVEEITFEERTDRTYLHSRVPTNLFRLWLFGYPQLWGSPILWSAMDAPRVSEDIHNNLGSRDIWTLRQVLLQLRANGQVLFMRKVSAAVRFDDAIMHALYGDATRDQVIEALAAALAVGEHADAERAVSATKVSAHAEVERQYHRGLYANETASCMQNLLSYRIWRLAFRAVGLDKVRLMRLFLASAVVSSLFILYAFPFPALQIFAVFAVCFVALTTAMECNVTTSFTPRTCV